MKAGTNLMTFQCVICKRGEVSPGEATVVRERDGMTLVIRGVPARVCSTCGEYYLDAPTLVEVQAMTESAFAGGGEVQVRRFAA